MNVRFAKACRAALKTLSSVICAGVVVSAVPVAQAGVDWSGKKVSILGDSYSTWAGTTGCQNPEYGPFDPNDPNYNAKFEKNYPSMDSVDKQWWAQVIARFGGELEVNRSCGSSAMTKDKQYKSFIYRANASNSGQGLGSPDVILVFGGFNDSWFKDAWGITDDSFTQGVTTLFANLKAAHPKAQVYVLLGKSHVAQNYQQGVLPEFRAVLEEKAEAAGFTTIDLNGCYGGEGDLANASFPHPTATGFKKIADRVISVINAGTVCKHPTTTTVVTTEPSCTEEGRQDIVCADCGEVLRSESISPKNHVWSEWATSAADPSKETRTCSVCTATETRAKGSHDDDLPDGWGYSNRTVIAGIPYCVLTFTNTAAPLTWDVPRHISFVDYLVVGGGGGGGSTTNFNYGAGGGGGGGAVVSGTVTGILPGQSATITVGAGGSGAVKQAEAGGNGGASLLALRGDHKALGGGGGGSIKKAPGEAGTGGGGVCRGDAASCAGGVGQQGGNGGKGAVFNGPSSGYNTYALCGGGGGGAGGNGGNSVARSVGGAGGIGIASDITGVSRYYGGGGGGGVGDDNKTIAALTRGLGGLGGGGNGAIGCMPSAGARDAVQGEPGSFFGGGGGGALRTSNEAGCGYQGVVIVRYMDLPAVPGHAHALGDFVTTLEPTCTSEGRAVATCEAVGCVGGPLTVTRTIPMLEHSWSAITVTKQPEVGKAGEATRTCSVCGKVETIELEALSAETGSADTAAVTYTWQGPDRGLWASPANWKASISSCHGIPDHATYATAAFPSSIADPIEVIGTGNFLANVLAFSNRGAVTLMGGTYGQSTAVQTLTFASNAKVLIDGASVRFNIMKPDAAQDVEVVVRRGGKLSNAKGGNSYGDSSKHVSIRVEGSGSEADIRSNTAMAHSIKGCDHVWEAVDGGKIYNGGNQCIFSDNTSFSQVRPVIRAADGGIFQMQNNSFLYGTRSDADTPTVVLEGVAPSFTSSYSGDALVLGTNTAASVVGKTTLRFVPPADGWTAAPMQATKGRAIVGANTSVIVDATKFALDGATVTLPLVYAKSGIEIDAAALASAKVTAPAGASGEVVLSADCTQLNAVITGGTPCDHATTATRTVAATCTTKGQIVTYCTACQKTLNTEYTDALGHDFHEDDWTDDPNDLTKEIHSCHRTGCTATESRAKPTPGPEPIPVALPVAVTGLKYNGQMQTGVPAGTGYTITDNTAMGPGDYEAKVTLEDGYVWSDGNQSKTRTIAWSIAPQGVDPEPPTPVTGEDWGYSNRVTVAGTDYMVVVFTNTSETLSWSLPSNVSSIDYVVVAGGGGGGAGNGYSTMRGGGGGGAGGLLHGTLSGSGSLTVSVGKGGAAGQSGVESTLTFGGVSLTADGGGAGAHDNDDGAAGGSGGGGGGKKWNSLGGAGVEGQGHAGGGGGGGGGGYAAVGTGGKAGAGGAGYEDPISGLTLAAGGRGGAPEGEDGNRDGDSGLAATGNGGEGAFGTGKKGGGGGSGVVIVRYALGGDEPQPTVKTATLPTAATGLVYNGETQTGVAAGEGYMITGNTGTDADDYEATLTLADGYGKWSDDSTEKTRTVAWSIAKGTNNWTTNPSVTPATWAEGSTPETIEFSNGANTFGAAVTCDTTAETLKALTAGESKVVAFTAAGCDNYDAITFEVTVTVTAKVDPPTPVTGEDWGYSNRVTVAGTDYMVVVFTNTEKTIGWMLPANVTEIDYLVVGGGGAGGTSGNAYGAGGGGAGGVTEGSCAVSSGAALAVTVGAGGEPGEANTDGGAGQGSSLAVGGSPVAAALPGAGGAKGASAGPGGATDYACGGGAGGGYTSQGTKAGGAGAVSNGGSAYGQVGAGGGGAGGDGQNSGMEDGGVGCGGVGVSTTIFDGLEQRIAGGGAGSPSGRTLNPSVDGGGAGGQVDAHGNHPATAGSTWGAGGGGAKSSAVGGAGHQGVVVVRYALGGTPEPQPDPVVPGKESKAYETEAAAKAAAPKTVTPPEAVSAALKDDAAALANYIACFAVVTRRNEAGQWVNVAELTETAKETLQQQVDGGAAKVVDALVGGKVTLDPVTPGFYYGLEYGEDLKTMTTDGQTFELAKGATLTLTLPKTAGATSGFYRVVVRESAGVVDFAD